MTLTDVVLASLLVPSIAPAGGALKPSEERPPRYDFVEVTTSKNFLICFDLSEEGHVCGIAYDTFFAVSDAFVWRNGQGLVLPAPGAAERVIASAVDSDGRVYGFYYDLVGASTFLHATSWVGGAIHGMDTPFQNVTSWPFASPDGSHEGINSVPFDHGTPGWKNEFGWVDEPDFTVTSGDQQLPWVRSAGNYEPVGTVTGAFRATLSDINDAGVGVGFVDYGGWGQAEAVRWDREQGMLLLGRGGRRASRASAINARGEIVGHVDRTVDPSSSGDRQVRPFIWRAGLWEELPIPAGFLHGRAEDINDAGIVVGSLGSEPSPFDTDGAWVYVDGVLHDLNDLVDPGSDPLTAAIRINEQGQILAAMDDGPSTGDRWVLLTPR